MMVPNADAPWGPPCPECHPKKTVQTYDHLDETRYLCATCEYEWMLIKFRYMSVKQNILH